MASNRTPHPEQIDRERRVVELRRSGATWEAIAEEVGYRTHAGAWQAYHRAMKRTLVASGTEELRALELDRLDRLQEALWPRAMAGEVPAVLASLRVLDRRAKYLGLDSPARVEVADAGAIDAEVARLVALLAAND